VINLKHLEAFVTVAELGSFRRAAERLNTTQPNISNRIAQIEAQLGLALMERDAGSVRLTARGRELLEPARAVLRALDGFVARAGNSTLYDGVLRLGVSEMVAHTWLSDFMLRMHDRFPNLAVELTVDLSANLTEALFAREIDLTFQNGPFDRTARVTIPLGQSTYAWVAAPGLGPAGRMTGQDMTAYRILTHARNTTPFRQLHDHFHGLGIAARLVPSSNIGACLQMTLDGIGIACLPRAMVQRQLAAGRLVELGYDWRPDPLRFAARYEHDPAPAYFAIAAEIAQGLSPPAPEDHES
jgi:DNA-binding transcriptional LysR family regulator